ncbi:universal stress protein [Armatimonas sp.]|uniref:universal stress protein n=1 Tax=Armatimonas sp. TaxID=1872638 RepID=UPI003750ABAF
MKIVLGVDSRMPEANAPVVSLLKRLAFVGSEVEVVHIVAPLVFPGGELLPVLSGLAASYYETHEWPDAGQVVAHVADELRTVYPTTETVVNGSPSHTLLTTAERSGAKLLALNASHDPVWKSAFVGSVARAAVLGAKESLLLARPALPDRPLHVVFATDHSPYADKCAALLGELFPRGVSELTVLTAFPIAAMRGQLLARGEAGAVASEQIEHGLMSRNADTIARLDAAFGESAPVMQSRVVDKPIDTAIADTMAETHADLLILGAHGHSLVERLITGSVSFRQALSSPYSVLLLRPS